MNRLTGYLSEYSLAEVLHLIEEGKSSGLLMIEPNRNVIKAPIDNYYLWFQGGRLISLTQTLQQTSLLKMLQQRQWLKSDVTPATIAVGLKSEQPLGLYLKSQGILSAEQLKLIFQTQVIQPVLNLFNLYHARFIFDRDRLPIKAEMTGLSISSTEVTLLGLRGLGNWERWSEKLPAPESSLIRCSESQITYKLDREEAHLWGLANGKESIASIAEQLGVSIESIRRIAFRLTVVGLLREVVIGREKARDRSKISPNPAIRSLVEDRDDRAGVSGSFLNNLMGFLHKKKKVA